MVAAITTLEQEIAHEERRVGLPVGEPLTDSSITRRRVQIEALLAACAFVALFALLVAGGLIRALAVALAVAFGVYAMEKDRHFRRLASLRDDTRKITLAVAAELMDSGALDPDRELLDLRDGLATAAGRLATGLAGVLPADSARVRLVGPSGEVPIAALRQIATRAQRIGRARKCARWAATAALKWAVKLCAETALNTRPRRSRYVRAARWRSRSGPPSG